MALATWAAVRDYTRETMAQRAIPAVALAVADAGREVFAEGFGVPQDYVHAYAWCNLSASRSEGDSRVESVKCRDTASEHLSPTQLAEAQRLSSNWQKGQSIHRE